MSTIEFINPNGSWRIRLKTELVDAEVIPTRPLDFGSSVIKDSFYQHLSAWRSAGYVTEDAVILTVFEQTGHDAGLSNFLADGLICREYFPKLIDCCRKKSATHDTTVTSDPNPVHFPSMRHPRPGIYPIVDQLDQFASLLDAGAEIIQLRIKSDRLTPEIRRTIAQAVQLSNQYPASQFFVNDYWQVAIDVGAYGVHLGQEDLLTADLDAIQQAGLRLGVSSHAFWEVARAMTISPSYIACGPVFPTRAKAMPWIAQGLENLRYWTHLIGVPVIGIGGVNADNLHDIHDTGCASASIIQAIVSAPNPAQAYRDLQAQWTHFTPPPARTIRLARPTLATA